MEKVRVCLCRYGSKEVFIDFIVREVLFRGNLQLYDSCVDDVKGQTETC